MDYISTADAVRAAFNAANLGNVKIVVDDDWVEIDGWLYISHEEFPSPINPRYNRTKWELSEAVCIPGTYWEPADIDMMPVFESSHQMDVIKAAGKRYVEHLMDQHFTALAEEAMCKEWEDQKQFEEAV